MDLPGDSVEGLVVVVVVAGRIEVALGSGVVSLSELWLSGLVPWSRDSPTASRVSLSHDCMPAKSNFCFAPAGSTLLLHCAKLLVD